MYEQPDSPAFIPTIKQTKLLERENYIQPDQKRRDDLGYHKRSASYTQIQKPESNSNLFPIEPKLQNSVLPMYKNALNKDWSATNSFSNAAFSYCQMNDEKALNKNPNQTELPTANSSKIRSSISNSRLFDFASPKSKGLEVKHFYEQETRQNDLSRESLVINRITSAGRTQRDSNSSKASQFNDKNVSGWLAEMERQRVELQKAREEEKRKQKFREIDRFEHLILEQQKKVGIETKLQQRDYSPLSRGSLAGRAQMTRSTLKYNHKEMFERNDLKNLLEGPKQRNHEDFSTQKDIQGSDQTDRNRKDSFKLRDFGSETTNPFHYAQSTMQKVKTDLNIATELTQRLLSSRDEQKLYEIRKVQPEKMSKNFTNQEKTLSRTYLHQNDQQSSSIRDPNELKLSHQGRDSAIKYPAVEDKNLRNSQTPFAENFSRYENEGVAFSFHSPTNGSIKAFEMKNTAIPSSFSKANSPAFAGRGKSNPRGSEFEKSKDVDSDRNSNIRLGNAYRESTHSQPNDGSKSRMTNTGDRFSSNLPASANSLYPHYTPENRNTRYSQKFNLEKDKKDFLSPEKTEEVEKEIREIASRLKIAYPISTHEKNKSLDASAITPLSNQQGFGERYQKGCESKVARNTNANYQFLITKETEGNRNYSRDSYSIIQESRPSAIPYAKKLESPSENFIKIEAILKKFRS